MKKPRPDPIDDTGVSLGRQPGQLDGEHPYQQIAQHECRDGKSANAEQRDETVDPAPTVARGKKPERDRN